MLNAIFDFVSQIIVYVGLFLAVIIIAIIMLSDGIKTWVKTTVFLVSAEGATAILGWIGWKTFYAGNLIGGAVCGIITLALAIVILWIAAVHHKTDWKKIQ